MGTILHNHKGGLKMKEKASIKASRNSFRIIEIVQIGLMAALTYIATAVIAIPVGDNAVLHIGDAVLSY